MVVRSSCFVPVPVSNQRIAERGLLGNRRRSPVNRTSALISGR